mmetsp:Transcript_87204/g.127560  ORF Transcript_87204/g.127560 Transcript_87204/m.127560 type:complete len:89 (+) Transcript_87204:168-434(+)
MVLTCFIEPFSSSAHVNIQRYLLHIAAPLIVPCDVQVLHDKPAVSPTKRRSSPQTVRLMRDAACDLHVPCSLTPAPQPKEDEQRLQGT